METIEVARATEAAGYDAAWTAEFLDRSAIVALAAMAQNTSKGPMMDASGFSTEAEQIRETFAARDYEGMMRSRCSRRAARHHRSHLRAHVPRCEWTG